MSVNRFYSPQEGRYVSQFVPEQMPVDMMVQALANKQKMQDERTAQLVTAGNWEQKALPGYDTDYIKQKKQEIQDFINQSQGKDLTSPDYFRNYTKFISTFKNDEGIKEVQKSVDTHNEYLKIDKEIRSGASVDAYEKAFYDDYQKRFNIYTSSKGQGYKGQVKLGDPNILRGTDINKEAESYFDQIKASGSETIKALESGISYKDGWKGVRGKTISQHASRMLDIFYESRAGQQLAARYDMQQTSGSPLPTSIIMQNLTPQERKTYEAERKAYVGQQLLNIGKGFIHGESSTNKDSALNSDRKEKEEMPQQPNISVTGNAMGFQMPSYDEALGVDGKPGMWQKNTDDIGNYLKTKNTYQSFIDQVNGKGNIGIVNGKPQLTQEEKTMLEGIPGGIDFINGKPLSPEAKGVFTKSIQGFVDDNQYKIHIAELYNKDLEEKMRTAIDNVNGGKKYGNGISFKAALELGDNLDNDKQVRQYKLKVQDMINAGMSKTAIDQWLLQSSLSLNEKAKANPAIKGAVAQVSEKLLDIAHWKDAEIDKMTTMKDKKALIKESFNNTPEYAPVATLKPSKQFYRAYELGTDGKPVSKGMVEHADFIIESLAQKQPEGFKIYIGKELIHPGDPRYPSSESLQLVSSNKELINDRDETNQLVGQKAVFNFQGAYKVTTQDPRSDKPEGMFSEVPQQYTLVASGIPLKNYTEAKAQEAYSNVVADKNYQSGNKFDFNNLSEAGKQSYIDYTMYKNPDKSKDIAKVNSLTEPGQRTTFKRNMFNLETGKKEDLNISVRKSDANDGTYIMKITDVHGETVLPERRLSNIVELSSTLNTYEDNVNAEGVRQNELGVQPKTTQGPYYNWLMEQILNPSVPINNSHLMKSAQ